MPRMFLLITALLFGSCKCNQTGVVYPTTACTNGATMCQNDRPYSCGGGVWRPVGTVESCGSVGGVCCLDSAQGVHACVTQDHCAPASSGGTAQ
jgi:hypothetical protein